MSSGKSDKKSKRDRTEHKSKKRHRDGDGQPEEGRKHKRSRSEALLNDSDADHLEATASSPSPTDAGVDGLNKKEQKRLRKQQLRRDRIGAGEEAQGSPSSAQMVAKANTSDPPILEASSDQVEAERRRRRKEKKRHQTTGQTVALEDATQGGDEPATEPVGEVHGARSHKQSKKHRMPAEANQTTEPQNAEPEDASLRIPDPTQADGQDKVAELQDRRRRKREKKEKRRREKELLASRKGDTTVTAQPDNVLGAESTQVVEDVDPMDIDVSPSKVSNRPFGKLPDQPYPFFTQQVSQYLPLFPLGMSEPMNGYIEQHLKPLLNHYVPAFKGVLLGYHEVCVGEAPGKGSITEQGEDTEEAVLESIDEYAVSFGWLTAKLDLFMPSRGAWMEGSINMQTEGHLGVVCWGMFNASIEAGRLPEGWRWIDLLGQSRSKSNGRGKDPEEARLPTPEPADENEGEVDVVQLHTTGYWVDDKSQRVRGTLRFQIKNFEVGVSGDYGYLSIEGTMLDEEAEKEKTAEEIEKLRRWKLKNSASRRGHKRMPDFSMTKFGLDEEQEQEDESMRTDVWKGSRPASETAE